MTRVLLFKCERRYDDSPHEVFFHGRRLDTDRRVVLRICDFYPHFYAQSCPARDDRIRAVSAPAFVSIEGDPLCRIELHDPSDTPDVRSECTLVHEADVPYTRRAVVDTGAWGVVEVELDERDETGAYVVPRDSIEPITNRPEESLRVAYFDIETAFNKDKSIEGQKESGEAPILCIGVSFRGEYDQWVLGDEESPAWHTVEVGGSDEVEAVLSAYYDESEMLESFIRWLRENKVEALAGWNSDDFDLPYIVKRARRLGIPDETWGEHGHVTYEPLNVPGIQSIDMLKIHRRATYNSFKHNTLKYVADHYCDIRLNKDPKDFIKMWEERPMDLFDYNIRDVVATRAIDEDRDYSGFGMGAAWLLYTEDVANVNKPTVGLDSLFLREARRRGMALPMNEIRPEEKVKGARVLEPTAGLHEWVAGIDAVSLYPSCIVAGNLSYETYTECDGECDHFIVPDVEHHFELSEEGIIPAVTQQVWEMKKEFGHLKRETDDDHYELLYDAAKIILNSVYGITLSPWFRLNRSEVGESVTALGRCMISNAKKTVETFGLDVVGGDSIPADEPVLIRDQNDVKDIVEVQRLEDMTNVEVWSSGRWTPVKRVIKKPNRKSLYTVRTPSGVVRVTEDHSLISKRGTELTPEEATKGTELLHKDIGEARGKNAEFGLNAERAWLLGVFVAEGSAQYYKYGEDQPNKHSWYISNQDTELLGRCRDVLLSQFSFKTSLLDVTKSSQCYRLLPSGNGHRSVASIARWFRQRCFTPSGKKRIPRTILNSSERVQNAFLRGYTEGDGHFSRGRRSWSTNSPTLAAGICFLLRSVGKEFNVYARQKRDEKGGGLYYRIREIGDKILSDAQCNRREITHIIPHSYNGDFVYDLETENHRFQAGAGSLIVHNTDSVYVPVEPGRPVEVAESLSKMIEQASQAEAAKLGCLHPDIFEWELEKVADRALFAPVKKRYALSTVWKDGEWLDEPKLEVTGFQKERSDTPEAAIRFQTDAFRLLLIDGVEADELYTSVNNWFAQVRDGKLPLHDICPTPRVKRDPESYTSNYYAATACLWSNRNIGTDFGAGERPYLLHVKDEDVRSIAITDEMDVPEGIEVDWGRHADLCVQKPVRRIFEALGEEEKLDGLGSRTLDSFS